MNTPIHDFVTRYLDSGISRLHMPGHKGVGPLGCEGRDITEIAGADELYAASGITFSEQHLDEDEFVEVVKMPFDELLNQILAGDVKDAKTIIAALKTDILRKNGRI